VPLFLQGVDAQIGILNWQLLPKVPAGLIRKINLKNEFYFNRMNSNSTMRSYMYLMTFENKYHHINM